MPFYSPPFDPLQDYDIKESEAMQNGKQEMGHDEYNFNVPLDRAEFITIAAELTGLKESSINATMKVEKNRANGKWAKGFRYTVTSKRNGVTVRALRNKR